MATPAALPLDGATSDVATPGSAPADADATVAIGNVGANGRVDTHTVQQPIASFVLTNVGLEAGVSVGGSRIVPIALP